MLRTTDGVGDRISVANADDPDAHDPVQTWRYDCRRWLDEESQTAVPTLGWNCLSVEDWDELSVDDWDTLPLDGWRAKHLQLRWGKPDFALAQRRGAAYDLSV